jgi:hypothetical protein
MRADRRREEGFLARFGINQRLCRTDVAELDPADEILKPGLNAAGRGNPELIAPRSIGGFPAELDASPHYERSQVSPWSDGYV